jgi:DDE superfamily endonuclease
LLLALPSLFVSLLSAFAPLFSDRVWPQAQVLLVGAILAPGQRTVTSCLRMMGLSQEHRVVNYHRVLSRARWRGREVSRLLLELLVNRFVPTGPMVLGVDDSIERGRGQRIQAQGIYRDPVRSSHSPFVKASGLRWVSLDAPGCGALGGPEVGLTLSRLSGAERVLQAETPETP